MFRLDCRHLMVLLLVLAGVSPVAAAQEEPENLFANGTFAESADGADAPPGWQRRGKEGAVTTASEGDVSFVRLDVPKNEAGQDNFIQQIAKVPENTPKVAVSVKYRHADVEAGAKSYQTGKVQGRFTKGGDETGGWIDLGNLKGSSDGWVEKSRTVTVPEGADGIMMRLGFYGVKAGRLDVAEVRAEPITEADVAAERAKYRPAEEYGKPVSDERYARLTRGMNINNWFCQPWNARSNGQKGGFNADHFRAYITDHDLKLMKDAGFNHIRLPVDPLFLFDKETGNLKTELLPELDRAIEQILSHDLAVIVDVHPKTPDFKKMSAKAGMPEKFITWWGQFARHLSKTDPERVFLELMNEPGGQGYWTSNWPAYQDKLIMTARANAPEHTLIANPGGYMLFKEIVKHEPHTDRNVVYAMHYYEPSPFTHQGAVWMKDWYRPLRDVPWPLTEENIAEAQARVDPKDEAAAKAREALSGIAKSGWGSKERITEHFKEMSDWARAHDRRLVIGEWGVYAKYAPREDRLRYLDYMTREMAKYGLGWSKWDYAGGGFPIVENPDAPSAERKLDAEVVRALNLKQ